MNSFLLGVAFVYQVAITFQLCHPPLFIFKIYWIWWRPGFGDASLSHYVYVDDVSISFLKDALIREVVPTISQKSGIRITSRE